MSERARAMGLGERLEVEAALETAFAPLRARRSEVGPTRVRAAVRWGRAEPRPPVPWAAAVSRISELGMAVGMSAFVFAAALTSVAPPASIPVSDAAVVDDMLVPPKPVVHRWTGRIVPASPEVEMRQMMRWVKFGITSRPVDYLDATIPPRQSQAETRVTVQIPQELVLRMPMPLR
ncbi:MAG TPA: hypothetical protein VMR66_03440 [Gemmatimonadota bacterium]|nr:hypothetical protein [Gemmatimonadota bacterium]